MKPGETGLKRVIHAFGYTGKGIKAAWIHEAAFRQEAILALLMLPLAFWVGDTPFELALLIFVNFAALAVEMLNSGIEAVVDRVGEEVHPLSGRAKDMGSAAVFFILSGAGLVWIILIIDRIKTLMG